MSFPLARLSLTPALMRPPLPRGGLQGLPGSCSSTLPSSDAGLYACDDLAGAATLSASWPLAL
eukprot:1766491-Prymnesium_polylepis.1